MKIKRCVGCERQKHFQITRQMQSGSTVGSNIVNARYVFRCKMEIKDCRKPEQPTKAPHNHRIPRCALI